MSDTHDGTTGAETGFPGGPAEATADEAVIGTWSDESEFTGWEDGGPDGEDVGPSSRPRRSRWSDGPTSVSRRW